MLHFLPLLTLLTIIYLVFDIVDVGGSLKKKGLHVELLRHQQDLNLRGINPYDF